MQREMLDLESISIKSRLRIAMAALGSSRRRTRIDRRRLFLLLLLSWYRGRVVDAKTLTSSTTSGSSLLSHNIEESAENK